MLATFFNIISLFVSFVVPAITTYRTLEFDSNRNLRPLVIYWLVFSALTVFESNFYFILKYVPLYHLIKLYLSFWLILPQTKGAEYIYYNSTKPFLDRYLNTIEKYIRESDFKKVFRDLLAILTSSKMSNRDSHLQNSQQSEENRPYQLLVHRLFEGKQEQAQSSVNVSLFSSLISVFQSLPHSYFRDEEVVNTEAVTKTNESGEMETNNSNGFDVVEKEEFDSVKAPDTDVVDVERYESSGWIGSWWSSNNGTKKRI